MKNVKFSLIVMNFMQFAVWGAYLTSIGNYLGSAGMGDLIPWFYAMQGIVSMFMPTLLGVVADKWIQPQKLLGYCQLIAGVFMLALWWMGRTAGLDHTLPASGLFLLLYSISVAFYMPTISLSNTVAFSVLRSKGLDTVKAFPPIRVFGTIGFIASMWFVNCAALTPDGSFTLTLAPSPYRFQYTYNQLLVSGVLGLLLGFFCFTLPKCVIAGTNKETSWTELFGLNAFKLFKVKRLAIFFIFSMLLGMCLQVTNSYAGPFITSFKGIGSQSFAANNATLLTSLSQISEAACILLIPFCLGKFGIKRVMLIAMFAWVLRFGLFGLGGPEMPSVILFILSMLVYGVAFDFFNVSGALFVESQTDKGIRASAQGLFMLITNGVGTTIGTLVTGKVVNAFCKWEAVGNESFLLGDWKAVWLIFAGFALCIAITFIFVFKENGDKINTTDAKLTESAPEGFVENA